MEEKIANTIALKQQMINELEALKLKVLKSEGKYVRFRVETKHWYGYGLDVHFGKEKDIIDVSKSAMQVILEEAINRERKRINILIDMEIEKKIGREK